MSDDSSTSELRVLWYGIAPDMDVRCVRVVNVYYGATLPAVQGRWHCRTVPRGGATYCVLPPSKKYDMTT